MKPLAKQNLPYFSIIIFHGMIDEQKINAILKQGILRMV